MQITGKLVLITGASSGIGAATARVIARRGGRVLLLARTPAALDQVADSIRAGGGTAHTYPVDLTDADAVTAVAQRIQTEVGVPDIIINNAGAGRWLFIEETSPAEAMSMMAVPYFAAFFITHAFMPAMLQRRSGHIVNITSPAGYFTWPGATAYAVARWAMRGLSEALRADLAGTGIGVTLFTTGKVDSPYFANNPGAEERIPTIVKLYPTLTPEQVAEAIAQAIEAESREVIIPFLLKLTVWFHRIFPQPTEWLLRRTGWRHPAAR